jgi:WD repeat and SOF domain-containing protein 1
MGLVGGWLTSAGQKVRVKVISRAEEEFTRERSTDLVRVQRNVDPALHPFERAREYTRALNATKLEKVFARPFVAALDGHSDGVYCISKHPRSLAQLISGSCDGGTILLSKTSNTDRLLHQRYECGICRVGT